MNRRSKIKAARESSVTPDLRWAAWGVAIGLAALVWAVFGQTVGHQFINFDDGPYIYENPYVSRGLTMQGVVWAFTHVHASNWHPLTWMSHMLDCQLYGLNPAGHHLTNLLLHATTAIVLFFVLRAVSGSLWRSAFVAALFAIHPQRVESVAWAAERKDMLSGLFFVLTIAAYLRYTRNPWSHGRYALVALFLGLGLMCKPMLVTTPLVILLLDYWPLNRLAAARTTLGPTSATQRLILEKLPLLAIAGASCLATLFAQADAILPVERIPVSWRLANAAIAYVDYLRQMVWPSDLAVFYPWQETQLSAVKIIFAIAILAAVSAAVFAFRPYRYLVTGWLWYLLMLMPVIGIVQVGNQARADRYTYLPQIGLYLLITWAVADLSSRWRHRAAVLASLSAILIGAFTFAARAQASFWKDSESLWTRTLSKTSSNAMAWLNLGEAVYKLGRIDEAIAHFERALQIQPNEPTTHGSLGAALWKIGRGEKALFHLHKSLEIAPKQAAVHSSLGVALLEIGRPEESMDHLEAALKIKPDDSNAHFNLGNTLLQLDRPGEAAAHYRRAVELNPRDAEALTNLAWILATSLDDRLRDGTQAIELAERADSLTMKKSPVIGASLAAAYAEANRFAEAVTTAERALQLALNETNEPRANSLRAQIELYRSNKPLRDAPGRKEMAQ
ncbi:MAG TPA: tetratricopeptide repeat protein [Chthoniobacterales bacterium]|jgi:tetratricopeptide (TPR) repeat protein|nr:tetratricopeptide repeat protein [Chthoniobacterales bacterium]